MRKIPTKPRTLNLKRETVRRLGALEMKEVVGGAAGAILPDTTDATCPWTHIAASAAC